MKLLTPKMLAEHWGTTVSTLSDWRLKGKGPKFVKVGRLVRYRMASIEAFERKQTVGR